MTAGPGAAGAAVAVSGDSFSPAGDGRLDLSAEAFFRVLVCFAIAELQCVNHHIHFAYRGHFSPKTVPRPQLAPE
jgi:hypothetical protein